MSYILNEKTKKYEVFIKIIPCGIKISQKVIVAQFDDENLAIAGAKVAKNIIENELIIPTNNQINNWISSKLNK
jgi:hypothetical protein